MVSIHRPLGYGPSTLPLRHAAVYGEVTENRYSLKGKPIISKGDEFNAQYSKEKEAPNKGLEPLTLRLKV